MGSDLAAAEDGAFRCPVPDQTRVGRPPQRYRPRLVVAQKAAWGKSLIYLIAAKLLREAGSSLAFLVSPAGVIN